MMQRIVVTWSRGNEVSNNDYKAEAAGMTVEHVSPAYTSQSCPACGHTSKSNRNGLRFRCVDCGYADNADRVGSINIGLRSLLGRTSALGRAPINRLIVTGYSEELAESQAPTL